MPRKRDQAMLVKNYSFSENICNDTTKKIRIKKIDKQKTGALVEVYFDTLPVVGK